MDRLTEMEAFVQVVDHGGFTEAARKLGLSKSAVSKHVSALEARLAVRLLNRTTRRVSPTEVGLAYYDRARAVLAQAGGGRQHGDRDAGDAEGHRCGSRRRSAFGVGQVAPAVAAFLCAYPEVDVQMVLEDRFVELVAEGYDVAMRIGTLADSSLRARKLAETRGVMVASPGYLAARRRAAHASTTSAAHRLLHYSHLSSGNFWRLRAAGGRGAAGAGRRAADRQQRRGADEGGRGRASASRWCRTSCSGTRSPAGRLVEVLPDRPADMLGVHAVYPAGPVPAAEAAGLHRLPGRAASRGGGPDNWAMTVQSSRSSAKA